MSRRSPSPALETLVTAIPSKERLPSPWTPLRVGPHPERTVSSSAPAHHLHLACGAGTLPGRRVRIAAPHLVALDATSCPHRKPMAGVKCYYGPMSLNKARDVALRGPCPRIRVCPCHSVNTLRVREIMSSALYRSFGEASLTIFSSIQLLIPHYSHCERRLPYTQELEGTYLVRIWSFIHCFSK
jgi:hypothetical protein